MSDLPSPDPPDGADLTAAEYALGVLDAAERRAAELRIAEDPAFARDADAWSKRLCPLAQAIVPVSPPAALWSRIEQVINRERSTLDAGSAKIVDLGLRRSMALWRAATAGMATLAAVLLGVLLLPHPARTPTQTRFVQAPGQPLLVARLQISRDGPTYVASLDPTSRELVLTPGNARAVKGRAPELWVIPTGGEPIAVGVVSFDRPVRLQAGRRIGGPGWTTLAVSIEPPHGSPTGRPTGPVVATGALTRL